MLTAHLLLRLTIAASLGASGSFSVTTRPAERYALPGAYNQDQKIDGDIDCNSPAHWDGETLYVFSSVTEPYRTSGPDLLRLDRKSKPTSYDNKVNGGRWIEATWKDPGGRLYGWYHNEPHPVCAEKPELTAPLIGAVVSDDNGMHWHDMGIVLKAPEDSKTCSTPNRYFAGGNGDFSVIADRKGEFLYFFISTYNVDKAEQGVAFARMRYADRDRPAGKAVKWYNGKWEEPGLEGHVTPVFPGDWHRPDADAFWGPSVHYNTHLACYVMLLNRAKDKEWAQEGIYVSFNTDLSKPGGWTRPLKILDGPQLERSKWYPQVMGTDTKARETDKLAGRVARLFVSGLSKWEIVFEK